MGKRCSRLAKRRRGNPEESHPSQPATPANSTDQPEHSARPPADSTTAPSTSSYSNTYSIPPVPEAAPLSLSVPETSSMASSLDPITPTRYMRRPTCHLASDIKANSNESVTHMHPAEDSLVVFDEVACTLESLSRTYVGILPASQQSSDVGKSGVEPDLGITSTGLMTNSDSCMKKVAQLQNNQDHSSAVSPPSEGDFVIGDTLGSPSDNVASTLGLTAVIERIASDDRQTSASQSLGLTPPSLCSSSDVHFDLVTPDILSMHYDGPLPLCHPTEMRPTKSIITEDVVEPAGLDLDAVLAPGCSSNDPVPSPAITDVTTEHPLVHSEVNDEATPADNATGGQQRAGPAHARGWTRQPSLRSAWDVVYTGGLKSWDKHAARFGLDRQPSRERNVCECLYFSGVCLQYLMATLTADVVHIERYGSSEVQIPLTPLLHVLPEDIQVEEYVLAWRRDLVLLCVTEPDSQWRAILPSRLAPQPGCLGLLYIDCDIFQCEISPDLAHTAILYHFSTGCYLFVYDNASLQRSPSVCGQDSPHCVWPEKYHRHLLQVVCLSQRQDDSPYFTYDPRYRHAQLAVTNYQSFETGHMHELAVLRLAPQCQAPVMEVQKSCQALPPLLGDVDFNLLYSRDGELIFLQKMNGNGGREAVNNHVYIFSADQLTLLNYINLSLSYWAECKVISEPAFSRCANFMRLIQEGAVKEVFVYRLPPSLRLMSQCRRAILSILPSVDLVDALPVPSTLKTFLNFEPSF